MQVFVVFVMVAFVRILGDLIVEIGIGFVIFLSIIVRIFYSRINLVRLLDWYLVTASDLVWHDIVIRYLIDRHINIRLRILAS